MLDFLICLFFVVFFALDVFFVDFFVEVAFFVEVDFFVVVGLIAAAVFALELELELAHVPKPVRQFAPQ